MARLTTLKPVLKAAEFRTVIPLKKAPDPELTTEAHRKWRGAVLRRANFACEKCGADGKTNRLFADHIKERRDGGALLDPANGMALCSSCHAKKTAQARARRMHDRHQIGE
jgi:5-methylcytosine-specific restriction endonuclease McrA